MTGEGPDRAEAESLPVALREQWERRLAAVGKAQTYYLWTLLVVGVFYGAVDAAVQSGSPSSALHVPVLGIGLSAFALWASAPFVVSLIVLAVVGTASAAHTAFVALGIQEGDPHAEAYDTAPNISGLIFYSGKRRSRAAVWLDHMAVPSFLMIFHFQAAIYLVDLWLLWPADPAWVAAVVLPSTATWLLAAFQLGRFTLYNGVRAPMRVMSQQRKAAD